MENKNTLITATKPDLALAESLFEKLLLSLGLDLENPHLKDTPQRFVKAWTEDICSSLYKEPPKITVFGENDYDGIVFQGGIDIKSLCAHHLLPFIGTAYVAYIPSNEVVGLSKLNRIVDYIARRPSVQESLTQHIRDYISSKIKNLGVAVLVKAKHLCVSCRGINQDSTMQTVSVSGAFMRDSKARSEFFSMINHHHHVI